MLLARFAGDSPHSMVPGREKRRVMNLVRVGLPGCGSRGENSGGYPFRKVVNTSHRARQRGMGYIAFPPLISGKSDPFHQIQLVRIFIMPV
jgi:hypothetical protein